MSRMWFLQKKAGDNNKSEGEKEKEINENRCRYIKWRTGA